MFNDAVLPFVFESMPVRGAIIQLRDSWRDMQAAHDYPAPVAGVLGQAAAATALVAHSLKFDGSITLQISGDGPLDMLVMQCTNSLDLRGMARHQPIVPEQFSELVGNARCAITLNHDKQEKPYQGIVSVKGETLAGCLEDYFVRSVQVPSHLQLVSNRDCAAGILLQQMPGENGQLDADDWRRLGFLAATLSPEDFTAGAGVGLLRKLFSEDDLRVFAHRDLRFRCRCSRQRVENLMRILGEKEARAVCEELGKVEVICEYCGKHRSLDAVDISRVFADHVVTGSDTLH